MCKVMLMLPHLVTIKATDIMQPGQHTARAITPVTGMVISKPTVMVMAMDMHKLTDTDRSMDMVKLMHSIKRQRLATDLDLELASQRKPRV